jgi:DNA replication licensing factor MCM2
MPHLDRYEQDGIGEAPEDYDPEAELEARLRAEAELDDRDVNEGRVGFAGQAGRVRPRALDADDDDDNWRRQQRRRRAADRDEDGEEDEEVRGDFRVWAPSKKPMFLFQPRTRSPRGPV